MEKENKIDLIKIIVSAALLLAAGLIDSNTALPMWGSLLLYLVPYLIAGYDVLLEAGENIAHGKVFNEDFLMSIATIGALCIGFLPDSEPEFAEAVFVMLFFKVGELFEEIAEGNSRKSISQLMDIRPDIANVERNGQVLTVDPDAVSVGEIIVIKPGEKVPMDGVVI
ncbi:MAG: heavy metal translocating P-type ATPase, partial [Eubacteriales bacterium]|nr:heavy metal translocating P-type ATPase [Eubacteriales bacterium]